MNSLQSLFDLAIASEKAEETIAFLNELHLFDQSDSADKELIEGQVFEHLMKINLKLLE